MLKRISNADGLVWYISPLLSAAGVRHAFSTRLGGCSPPPFDSLNLGNPSGSPIQDDYDRIWANYRTLLTAIDCPGEAPLRVHQVHGCGVVEARSHTAFDVNCRADAIVSDDPARPVSVRIADCVPVLLASANGRCVAAIHAGWRGIVAGVVPGALASLMRIAANRSAADVIAAIGPSIGPGAFEVGPEVLDEFEKLLGNNAPIRRVPGGKGYVDLREAIRLQLVAAGVGAARIDTTDCCTFRDVHEFFSHRRDNGITGRLAAIIAPNRGE